MRTDAATDGYSTFVDRRHTTRHAVAMHGGALYLFLLRRRGAMRNLSSRSSIRRRTRVAATSVNVGVRMATVPKAKAAVPVPDGAPMQYVTRLDEVSVSSRTRYVPTSSVAPYSPAAHLLGRGTAKYQGSESYVRSSMYNRLLHTLSTSGTCDTAVMHKDTLLLFSTRHHRLSILSEPMGIPYLAHVLNMDIGALFG
jgi:hypothetical protein